MLDHVERGIVNLTVEVVERVESVVLGIELVKIVRKLKQALMSDFVKRMGEIGLSLARKLAAQAVAWGYAAAKSWASERSFIMYVTLLDVNSPSGWGP